MLHERIAANDFRIPPPRRGAALIVTRYGDEQVKAVVLHPEDFMSIEAVIDAYLARPPYDTQASDLALRGHRLVETPGAEGSADFDNLDAALAE